MVRREKRTGYFYCSCCVLGRVFGTVCQTVPFSMVQASIGKSCQFPLDSPGPWALVTPPPLIVPPTQKVAVAFCFCCYLDSLFFIFLPFQLCLHLFNRSPVLNSFFWTLSCEFFLSLILLFFLSFFLSFLTSFPLSFLSFKVCTLLNRIQVSAQVSPSCLHASTSLPGRPKAFIIHLKLGR